MSILETAQELIHGDRNVSYGHPRENFKAIADQWNAYLDNIGDRKLNVLDVANLMILMKVARVVNGVYHQDSYTDIAGYAGTAERTQEPEEDHPEDRTWIVDGRQYWARFNDIPAGIKVNSSDEDDSVEPWLSDPGAWEGEGDFGEGPWREHISGRKWEHLDEVPVGVVVKDGEGDQWRRYTRGAKLRARRSSSVKWSSGELYMTPNKDLSDNDIYGPFTEVL